MRFAFCSEATIEVDQSLVPAEGGRDGLSEATPITPASLYDRDRNDVRSGCFDCNFGNHLLGLKPADQALHQFVRASAREKRVGVAFRTGGFRDPRYGFSHDRRARCVDHITLR
jgi:hypothetical protein